MAAPVLVIDDREPYEKIGDVLQEEDVPFEVDRLDVGDFAWTVNTELILVSRKGSDFMSSLYSNHMQDEFTRCIQAIKDYGDGKLFFLDEGVWAPAIGGPGINYYKRAGDEWWRRSYKQGGNKKVRTGSFVSMATAGILTIPTADIYETSLALTAIYKKSLLGWPTKIAAGLPKVDLKWSMSNSMTFRLCALWPHLREEVAESLLSTHGTIGNVVDAVRSNPKELVKETNGLGKTGINNILRVLGVEEI
ncbi:hypothetical protein LCGC14_2021180 [marine sediment metagenome]|uniref:ERCC4 domain-containing protein n=1 Tax=marine sediment metagenome TaxID=412755 RepID=A0A0F9EXK9_9ZZZZ